MSEIPEQGNLTSAYNYAKGPHLRDSFQLPQGSQALALRPAKTVNCLAERGNEEAPKRIQAVNKQSAFVNRPLRSAFNNHRHERSQQLIQRHVQWWLASLQSSGSDAQLSSKVGLPVRPDQVEFMALKYTLLQISSMFAQPKASLFEGLGTICPSRSCGSSVGNRQRQCCATWKNPIDQCASSCRQCAEGRFAGHAKGSNLLGATKRGPKRGKPIKVRSGQFAGCESCKPERAMGEIMTTICKKS